MLILDPVPAIAAGLLCDQHIGSTIISTSTSLVMAAATYGIHPRDENVAAQFAAIMPKSGTNSDDVRWVSSSLQATQFTIRYARAVGRQFQLRNQRITGEAVKPHASTAILDWISSKLTMQSLVAEMRAATGRDFDLDDVPPDQEYFTPGPVDGIAISNQRLKYCRLERKWVIRARVRTALAVVFNGNMFSAAWLPTAQYPVMQWSPPGARGEWMPKPGTLPSFTPTDRDIDTAARFTRRNKFDINNPGEEVVVELAKLMSLS